MTTANTSPVLQRRRLGNELRRRRDEVGKKLDEVAEYLECSEAKISRIENGKCPVLARDVRDMLELYGVPVDERQNLIDMARATQGKGWWHRYADAVPDHFPTFVGLEAAADEVQTYEPAFVPGLLQTEDYARELMMAGISPKPDLVDRAVELRMQRQRRLTDSIDPLRLVAVVDESVLVRRVGGDRVMRQQCARLAELGELPNVSLRFIGFDHGAYPGMGVPFVVLHFPDPEDGGVVFMEQQTSALYLEDPDDVERYRLVFKKMSELAVRSVDTVGLARAMADRNYL